MGIAPVADLSLRLTHIERLLGEIHCAILGKYHVRAPSLFGVQGPASGVTTSRSNRRRLRAGATRRRMWLASIESSEDRNSHSSHDQFVGFWGKMDTFHEPLPARQWCSFAGRLQNRKLLVSLTFVLQMKWRFEQWTGSNRKSIVFVSAKMLLSRNGKAQSAIFLLRYMLNFYK